jgi:bifunctional NMN adenylyltransferase/nudix hydrolase
MLLTFFGKCEILIQCKRYTKIKYGDFLQVINNVDKDNSMLKKTTAKADIGVICARFQVHELTKGQIELIETVRASHDRVMIFLGLSPLRGEPENPLDLRSRKVMLAETFPDIKDVYYIDDVCDDNIWSKNLDFQINKWKNPNQTVILYGSRDGFQKKYNGRYPTIELEAVTIISGTEIRRQVCNAYHPDKSYRAGVIAATAFRYPHADQAVDVAVLDRKNRKVLFIRKTDEPKLRFPGGYTSKESDSLEDDGRREIIEETKLEIGPLTYVASGRVKDWRYEGKIDCIKTVLFVADYIFGKPDVKNNVDPSEKIAEYHWVSWDNLVDDMFQPEHVRIVGWLRDFLKEEERRQDELDPQKSIVDVDSV